MRSALLLALSLTVGSISPGQRPPDTVRLEELTWTELRDLMRAGLTSVIIATAGTEQKGPHMVTGQHRFVLEYTTEKIARAVGNTVVAPIITYVPEGEWDPPSGHMTKAGTISLPNERFMALLENTGRSFKGGGFKNIFLLGDSGGNQDGMRAVVDKLNGEWKDSGVRVHFIGDYYAKSEQDAAKYLMEKHGFTSAQIGQHASVDATSELMFVNAGYVRRDKIAPGTPESGVVGDPSKASAEIGKALVQIKIDNAVRQMKASLAEKRP
ncbi:MAG TPA: creatininase family protein [Gemmatimonadaceae bacterium]|nr:creatininase family protein [Gemmatimonadaceae bacterium]